MSGDAPFESVRDLEARLAAARKREADLAATFCLECKGAGWFEDTTYDRTGAWCVCSKCYGTGWPIGRVRQALDQAFKGHFKPKPGG
jgi:hypothetical protein